MAVDFLNCPTESREVPKKPTKFLFLYSLKCMNVCFNTTKSQEAQFWHKVKWKVCFLRFFLLRRAGGEIWDELVLY